VIRLSLIGLLAGSAMALAALPAAADTIRVGVIGPFSGPYSNQGRNFQAGIDAWFALNGRSVGDDEIEVVYRDLPAADPARARALAQELVVSDGVQYLAGVYFTPDALAIAPLLEEANTPLVIFNAATSAITKQSPLIVRTSFTLPQTSAPMADVARERGLGRVVTVVSDYGPGADAENAFSAAFEAKGGQIVEKIRMPLATNDFSPIMQRVRASGADALFAFLPSGPSTLAFARAYNDNGLKGAGITFLAPGDLTQESDLPALGANVEGFLTTFHYSVAHDSPENQAFVAAARTAIGDPQLLTFPAVGAFDGMRVIAAMIEATGGEQDAAAAVEAVKGMSFESPRGPVTIDAQTRSPTQTIYLREVARAADGTLANREIQSFDNTPDLGWQN